MFLAVIDGKKKITFSLIKATTAGSVLQSALLANSEWLASNRGRLNRVLAAQEERHKEVFGRASQQEGTFEYIL